MIKKLSFLLQAASFSFIALSHPKLASADMVFPLSAVPTGPFSFSGLGEYLLVLLLAIVANTIVELFIAIIFTSLKYKLFSWRLMFSVILANIITLPIFWFSYSLIGGFLSPLIAKYDAYVVLAICLFLLGETLVIIFEGFLIYKLNSNLIALGDVLVLSSFANICSFIFGNILMIFMPLFFFSPITWIILIGFFLIYGVLKFLRQRGI